MRSGAAPPSPRAASTNSKGVSQFGQAKRSGPALPRSNMRSVEYSVTRVVIQRCRQAVCTQRIEPRQRQGETSSPASAPL